MDKPIGIEVLSWDVDDGENKKHATRIYGTISRKGMCRIIDIMDKEGGPEYMPDRYLVSAVGDLGG